MAGPDVFDAVQAAIKALERDQSFKTFKVSFMNLIRYETISVIPKPHENAKPWVKEGATVINALIGALKWGFMAATFIEGFVKR